MMRKNIRWCLRIAALILLLGAITDSFGQGGGILRRLPRGGGGGGGGGNDSLQKRNNLEDSITITFRYLDSSRAQKFDSSITDFTRRFPVPWYHNHLGNVGNATRSLIFSPTMKAGWDIGFHQFDVYNFTEHDTRFYNTTRPLTEIQYQLGSRLEQLLGIFHTQNIQPNWNASFQYRLINSVGSFRNQASNHNNYRFTSWFQSKNKRYQNFFIVAANKLEAGENGGIRTDINYLDTIGFEERSTIPTKLGPSQSATSRDFLSSNLPTANRYTTATYLLRQQYDLIGQKDSIETDSSVIMLFYPRVRLEHTFAYRTYNYRFMDFAVDTSYDYYQAFYGADSTEYTRLRDTLKVISNDFSIYQFPDAKNSQQFFKAGARLDLLTGIFDTGLVTNKYHNFLIHGEYRNKTRNRKWDIEASGSFYVNGMNAGDYDARISLKRMISKKFGFLEVGFGNVNRTPSFPLSDSTSDFYIGEYRNLNKENTTEIFGSFELPQRQLKLGARYMLLSNYSYYSGYKQVSQYNTLFNVLQVTAEKQFKLFRNWNWRTWVVVQQLTGNPPVNVPLVLTRNQIGYDGKLGFKNLQTSFGLELRYFTPYKADRYSPVIGQFFNQNDTTVRMTVPELGAYLHFRIRTFTAYVRLENLNTFNFSSGGFTRNAIYTPDYPYPGMLLRVGVYWSFIN
jgi:hypothetical protein